MRHTKKLTIKGYIVLTDKIKVYILELPKIERMKSEDKNLNLWIKFIKDLEVKHMADNKEKDEKLEETIKAIQEAKKKYEELCQDEHARYIAELREKYIEETASVRQMGYEEGLEKGLEKEKKEIAKIMKEKKYSIEEIMQITELTKEEIEKL
jgi:predicted transposase/invertase (TIGR01784 family)